MSTTKGLQESLRSRASRDELSRDPSGERALRLRLMEAISIGGSAQG